MDIRELELIKLKKYIDYVDKETTLLLQNLQWDHKHLIKSPAMVSCKYVAEHRIPLHSAEAHEKQCYLTQEGYSKEDVLLPDPVDPNADTVVKLSTEDIRKIINTASSLDPSFKRGSGAAEPMSAARLQQAYSADERRAIHEAVVAAAPACHDLADLELGSSSSGPRASRAKSRAEILSELRDMKRRRTRYRVAAKTANYSDVLRDVIKTQMELYAEAKGIFIKTEYGPKTYVSLNEPMESENNFTNTIIKRERPSPDTDDYRYRESENNSTNMVINQERASPNTDDYRHRERSRGIERTRQRTVYQDRDTVSKKRRHYDETTSGKTKHKHSSQDNYSKEGRRYGDGYSKRDSYHRNEDVTYERSRHGSNATDESSTSRYFGRHNEKDRDQNKYEDRSYGDSYKNATNYESGSKEYEHRNHKGSSKNSKHDKRKCDEYRRNHKNSNKYQEE